ncbi:hypothetical protein Hanom_Chr05g00447241 [Helianthus anomalus]
MTYLLHGKGIPIHTVEKWVCFYLLNREFQIQFTINQFSRLKNPTSDDPCAPRR